jgi:enoyl-CoA hydratase/carnithine racemase
VDKVRIESKDFVKTVILNRPEKRNALDLEMLDMLYEVFSEVPSPGDRVIVIRGEGPSFCAGIDLAEREKKTIDWLCEPCRTCFPRNGNASLANSICCAWCRDSRGM